MSAVTETDEYGKFVRRILRAYKRRVAAQDIEGLAGLVALRSELDDTIGEAVATLNGQGYSWAEIGRVLGQSRQGAQQAHGRWLARSA